MNDLVDQFESLIMRLQEHLVNNEVEGVRQVVELQAIALNELVQATGADPGLKEKLRMKMPEWTAKIQRNEALLQQGMNLANETMRALRTAGRTTSVVYRHPGTLRTKD